MTLTGVKPLKERAPPLALGTLRSEVPKMVVSAGQTKSGQVKERADGSSVSLQIASWTQSPTPETRVKTSG